MDPRADLARLCAPIVARCSTLDPGDPAACEIALGQLDLGSVRAAVLAAAGAGTLTPREAGGVKFGRIAKPSPETLGYSIDAVDMSGPAAGAHAHPRGEFDLCFPVEGDPRFDGRPGPWVVYAPGSRHVPTVSGGRMLILYFLPGGEIVFDAPS
jgi:hypothetical protein